MAKPKEERNISALDYLCKELNWLVNKIETSSRGKISKRDLLIYVFVGIFIVSVYFGKVIGGFTFVLVLVTLWNTTITRGLLRRSAEAFEQSRITFLIDIIDRTIEHLEKLPEHNKRAEETSYIINKARAIGKINKEISLELLESMVDWQKGKTEEINKEIKKHEEELKKDKKVPEWATYVSGWPEGWTRSKVRRIINAKNSNPKL